MSKLRAIGCMIFTGSATIGVEKAGYEVDRVLEISNDIGDYNARHFIKNRPDVPIILPSEWENSEYLKNLATENYDLFYANCPCSSLSQLNKNASVDGKNNVHFYRVFDAIKAIKPKTFFIENAPTAVKLGFPILKDMIYRFKDEYNITIIRDQAGSHDVPMRRMRTLLVGFRKDVVNNKLPILHMNLKSKMTCVDAIGDLYNTPLGDPSVNNHTLINEKPWSPVEHLYNLVPDNTSAMMTLIDGFDKYEPLIQGTTVYNEITRNREKLLNGQRLWDKSPYRVAENSWCPSMTSVALLIHPIHNRTFTIREYARLMGYPDSFIFHPETCKIPIIQCISQGVPANFVAYIASGIGEVLRGNRELLSDSEDKAFIFQHHNHKLFKTYSLGDLETMTELDSDKTFEKLLK